MKILNISVIGLANARVVQIRTVPARPTDRRYLAAAGHQTVRATARIQNGSIVVEEPGELIEGKEPIFIPDSFAMSVERGFASIEENGELNESARRSVKHELNEMVDNVYSEQFARSLDEE
ncbi:MAG: hypothetical protein JW782_06215 [Candidatus Saganbacteria bacterium]|nr:hypothetical protein [Candidatus Saganbacteria bacterium]